MNGACVAGDPLNCDDGNDCTIDSCSEGEGGCLFTPRDLDDDGFGDATCGGTDCDDARDDIYPGAPGSCNEDEDANCTGTPDLDDDQDGYVDADCPSGDDCDDDDPDTYPGAPEVCLDGKDQDCDGIVDGPGLMLSSDEELCSGTIASTASMCWTGSAYGVVWEDTDYLSCTLYFALVEEDGPLFSETLHLSTPCASDPTLFWTGSEMALVYGDYVCYDNLPFGGAGCRGFGARLLRFSSDGDAIGEQVSLTEDGSLFHAAWTGSAIGLVWEDSDSSYCIFFKMLSPIGEAWSEEVRVPGSCASPGSVYPRIAWSGSEFGVAWLHRHDIYFRRMSPDAASLGIAWQITTSGIVATIPDLFWTGSGYGIFWEEEEDPWSRKVNFTRLSPVGEPEGLVLTLLEPDAGPGFFATAWTGSGFSLLWCGEEGYYGDVMLTSLSPEGSRIRDDLRIAEAQCYDVQPFHSPLGLAWTGSELGVSWNRVTEDSGYPRFSVTFNRIGFCD